ncbi:uncharacterized protein [Diabrotica undecimpunctata]|uniref:uncharacterized protein n=1 Tax=Diabrotica undecimpunctata TaxID=50387 RepID=UPI003B63D744
MPEVPTSSLKDYQLKDVPWVFKSSSQFTPYYTRVTQSNLGKYCVPVTSKDDELPKRGPSVIHPKILENMMFDERYSWLARPGKEDFFIHEMYRKFTPDRSKGMYDPRYMHKEKIFNRSYQFELDCIEAERLEKRRVKNETDAAEFEGSFQRLVKKQVEKESPPIPLVPCKIEPPFWWPKTPQPDEEIIEPVKITPVYTRSHARWIEEPNLTAFVQDNLCQRKKDMLLVGQPFKTEACNWYYKIYPPPDIKFVPKRLQ